MNRLIYCTRYLDHIRAYAILIILVLISCKKDEVKKNKDYSGTYSCEVYETDDFIAAGPGFEDYFTDTTYYETLVVEYSPDTIIINGVSVFWSIKHNDSTYSLYDNWDNSSELKFRNDSILMDRQNKNSTVGIGTLTSWRYFRGIK